MNKKLLTYLVIFSFIFVGITHVSADEEENGSGSNDTAEPTLFQNNTETRPAPRPVNTEISRKTTLQEQYKQKLDDLKSRYTERKTSVQTERVNNSAQNGIKPEERNGLSPEERNNLTEEKRTITKERTEERRELIREKLEGQRKERVGSHISKVGESFENAIERIHELEKKIHGRIRDMVARGFDMTKSEELIAGTHTKIDEARAKIQEMKTALEAIVESEDPSVAFAEARELTDPAKEAVRAAHQSLVEVITSMKASIKLQIEEQSTVGDNDADENDTNNTDENDDANDNDDGSDAEDGGENNEDGGADE